MDPEKHYMFIIHFTYIVYQLTVYENLTISFNENHLSDSLLILKSIRLYCLIIMYRLPYAESVDKHRCIQYAYVDLLSLPIT